jgi:hypothetical protein
VKTLLVLGATGTMGRRVVALARQTLPGVEVRALSRSGGGVPGATALELDLGDAGALGQAVAGTDLVVNAVGPYTYDPAPLVAACVAACAHYTDLAEAPEFVAAVARAAERAGAASRGVVVVPGASTVPGLVQLLASAWAEREDVAAITAWLSLGSRNPVGLGLLLGLLRPLGRPSPEAGSYFASTRTRVGPEGRPLRYGRYPTGFAEDRVRLHHGAEDERRVPLRFFVGFDRALLVRGLAAAAPALARLSDAALRRLARVALPAARAWAPFGTPRGSLVLEARDELGEVTQVIEVVAEREGLDIPAAPPVWIARRLQEDPPARAGCLALDEVVPLAAAAAWLREAGYEVRGVPGLPPARDEPQARARAALARIERLGTLLDSSIRVPFTDFKIGLDPLIGMIPGVGDLLGGLLSGWIVFESWRLKVPRRALLRMATNVTLEFVVGLVPVLGDLFDFGYKANVRNARIAEEAIVRRHFPPEDELGEVPLWRRPRPLVILTAASLLYVFVLGYVAGSCGSP